MGRPPMPSTGGPGFRFTQEEVAEMESLLRHLNNGIPDGSLIQSLADRFTASAARAGKVGVRSKQNRKYSQRSRNSTKMLPAASGDHKSAFARSSGMMLLPSFPIDCPSLVNWKYGFDFLDLELGTTNGLMSVHVCGNVLIHVCQPNVPLFFLGTKFFASRKANIRLCILMLMSLMLKSVGMMQEVVVADFLFAMIMMTLRKLFH
ncbi:uncharacterized protein [Oryza sativa Japonica Group]|uniref:uncharacterized protein isoform X4 n=1 Tax=Oryza sativa subsp. japonica TaxID=39947 RepID=UPI000775377E|nr:uncharacterized protein LOC4341060 isoform X4 [Oryza sativa Japonica Group]